MSLIPVDLFFDDWWPARQRYQQQQTHPLDELLALAAAQPRQHPHQHQQRSWRGLEPWPLDALVRPDVAAGRASVTDNSQKFAIDIDARQFKPEELKVSFDNGVVSIEGRHEETGEHGSSVRQFTRRYKLPDNVDQDKLNSSLSKDGVLSIQAPKLQLEGQKQQTVAIPIQRGDGGKADKK